MYSGEATVGYRVITEHPNSDGGPHGVHPAGVPRRGSVMEALPAPSAAARHVCPARLQTLHTDGPLAPLEPVSTREELTAFCHLPERDFLLLLTEPTFVSSSHPEFSSSKVGQSVASKKSHHSSAQRGCEVTFKAFRAKASAGNSNPKRTQGVAAKKTQPAPLTGGTGSFWK